VIIQMKMYSCMLTLLLLMSVQRGDVYIGKASYYGGPKDKTVKRGQMMASGYRFDPDRLEAAHKTLPFGTVVYVRRYMKEGPDLYTSAVITDRGPYIKGRIIDLTPAGAEQLDMIHSGVVPVKVLVMKVGPCKTYKCYKKHPYQRGRKVK